LIHGFSGDLNNWRGLIGASRLDAPVLALDLPGHGRSSRTIPESLDDIATHVEATLRSRGVTSPVIAGHSFGALVAARIAAQRTLDVGGLALFAPAGLGPAINREFIDGILRASTPESLRPWLAELVHDPAIITDVVVRMAVEARRDADLTGAMRRFADIFMPDGTQRCSILPDLEGLSMPARVIFGRNDRILPFHETARLPAHVALHAVRDCGHMPHLEHPALAQRILSELLATAK
jgi:pyruvate dehydrogenase E2 component (dihydrolipoamide acetyltransferase)